MSLDKQRYIGRKYPIRMDKERSFEKITGQASVAVE